MTRRRPPRKVTFFEPVPPRLARNTIIESTFDVGRRFRYTMRVDCGELDPGAVIRPVPANGTRACLRSSTRRSWRTGAPAATRSISSRRSPSVRLSRSPTHEPGITALLYGRCAPGTERRGHHIEKPRRGGRGFRADERAEKVDRPGNI
jgi:hypothetical protein